MKFKVSNVYKKSIKSFFLTAALLSTSAYASSISMPGGEIDADIKSSGQAFSESFRNALQKGDTKDLKIEDSIPPAEHFVRVAIEMILEALRLQEMAKNQKEGDDPIDASRAINAGQQVFGDLIKKHTPKVEAKHIEIKPKKHETIKKVVEKHVPVEVSKNVEIKTVPVEVPKKVVENHVHVEVPEKVEENPVPVEKYEEDSENKKQVLHQEPTVEHFDPEANKELGNALDKIENAVPPKPEYNVENMGVKNEEGEKNHSIGSPFPIASTPIKEGDEQKNNETDFKNPFETVELEKKQEQPKVENHATIIANEHMKVTNFETLLDIFIEKKSIYKDEDLIEQYTEQEKTDILQKKVNEIKAIDEKVKAWDALDKGDTFKQKVFVPFTENDLDQINVKDLAIIASKGQIYSEYKKRSITRHLNENIAKIIKEKLSDDEALGVEILQILNKTQLGKAIADIPVGGAFGVGKKSLNERLPDYKKAFEKQEKKQSKSQPKSSVDKAN